MKRIGFFLILICVALAFCACFKSYQGYGVVLWSEAEDPFANGDVVGILSESRLNEAYVVEVPEEDREVMLPLWKVEFFESREEAEAYAAEYAPYTDLYVYSTQDGIPPIREEIGNSNAIRIVYKFKENQVAKVLSRTPEKYRIQDMEDYWYYVLIKNDVPLGGGRYQTVGIKGYCFGYSLTVVTAESADQVIPEEGTGEEEEDLLGLLFTGNWRPLSMYEMISSGKIDLAKVKPQWGLFADKEQQRITINLEDVRYVADYREIVELQPDIYSFPDSNLKIELLSRYRLSATFIADKAQRNVNFANMRATPEVVIENELARRAEIYERFFSAGPVLSSSVYGTITLQEGKRFLWTGLDKLVPGIIPRQVSGSGQISFPYYLAESLEGKYDGVITFQFDDYKINGGINFLYQFQDEGVKLFFVENNNLQEQEIVREGSNQFIIFFYFEDT